MGKKREEERGRGRKQEGSRKGKKVDSAAKSSLDTGENASPYQASKFAGKMVVAVCPSVSDRVVPGLEPGQALANPKRSGHRCTVCGNDVAAGHVVVRAA